MSSLVCPDCGSDMVMTERRPDGYHICRKCCFYWRNEAKPKQTIFKEITQSEEALAEKLVYITVTAWGETVYMSTIIRDRMFKTREEAIAATVARLKEVAE